MVPTVRSSTQLDTVAVQALVLALEGKDTDIMTGYPLRRDSRGKTYISLADAALDGETAEDLREAYLDVRGPEHVGFTILGRKEWAFEGDTLVAADEF